MQPRQNRLTNGEISPVSLLWDIVLLPAERSDDFLIAPGEDDAAILNGLDRDLIRLASHLQAELLAFLHDFTIHDSEPVGPSERDGSHEKRGGGNLRSRVFGCSGFGCACRRLPSDWPEWIARIFDTET